MVFYSHSEIASLSKSVGQTIGWICCFLIIGSNGQANRRPITVGQPSPTLAQRVESLENRVIIVEAGDYDRRIASLNSYIASEVLKLKKELNSSISSLKFVQSDINYLFQERDSMSTEIKAIKTNLSANDAEVDAIEKQIEHLNSVNKKWRANFIVVNKTFDELRKKYNTGRG